MSYYQTIYNVLRAGGLTQAGALGMLGNWDCESNCEPFRLQGDFSPYRSASHQYVADVTSGKIPMMQFASDQKGFGLAQWTYFDFASGRGRKLDLYEFWKQSGKALDSAEMQAEFCLWELATQGEYATVSNTVKSSNDLYECVKIICYRYEKPAINNVDPRYQAALRIKDQIDLDPQPVPPEPPSPPEPPDPPMEIFWPPRIIDCHCADWPEVTVLGSVLYCRGYLTYAIGYWDDEMTEAVRDFQLDNSLAVDGCVGPMTWKVLLEM